MEHMPTREHSHAEVLPSLHETRTFWEEIHLDLVERFHGYGTFLVLLVRGKDIQSVDGDWHGENLLPIIVGCEDMLYKIFLRVALPGSTIGLHGRSEQMCQVGEHVRSD